MGILPEQPVFPKAWRYYNTVVVIMGFILVVLNTLEGEHVFPPEIDKWVPPVISLMVALLVWLNQRRHALGYSGGELPPQVEKAIADEQGRHAKPGFVDPAKGKTPD